MDQAFDSWFLNAQHLRPQSNDISSLTAKLKTSFSAYAGKDSLKLVKKSAGHHYWENSMRRHGIDIIDFNALKSQFSRVHEVDKEHDNDIIGESPSLPGNGAGQETLAGYDKPYIDAVVMVQRWWKRMLPLIKHERELRKSPTGRLTLQLRKFARDNAISAMVLDILISQGVPLFKQHGKLVAVANSAQSTAARKIDELPQERWDADFDAISSALDGSRSLGEELESKADSFTAEALQILALRADLNGVRATLEARGEDLRRLQTALAKVEQSLKSFG